MATSLNKLIDIHVLTHSGTKHEWLDQCLKSLEGQPVVVHVVEGVEGSVGAGRAKGYALGNCEYVGYVDSDDYVLPGHYDLCREGLKSHRAVVGMELVVSSYCDEVIGQHNGAVYRRDDITLLIPAIQVADFTADELTRMRLMPRQLPHIGYVWRRHPLGAHTRVKHLRALAEAEAWNAVLGERATR